MSWFTIDFSKLLPKNMNIESLYIKAEWKNLAEGIGLENEIKCQVSEDKSNALIEVPWFSGASSGQREPYR